MKQSKLFHSVVFLVLMIGLTSCYTRLGYVSKEQAYEEYSNNPEAYEDAVDEYDVGDIVVRHHVYVPSIYHPTYIYFDPYDAWYFEPGFHFSFGYYTGPAYIYTGAYYCYPPVYYPPYYYPPHHYPFPVYGHPVWVRGGHYGPRYTYNPPVMKRRGSTRRGEHVLVSSGQPLKRRSSGNSGQLTRRTVTNAPSKGSADEGRRRIDKRLTKYNPTENAYYGRNSDRKRTSTTYTKKSSNEERRDTKSRNRKTYTSSDSKKSGSGYKAPSSSRSGGSSTKRVSGTSSRRSTPSVYRNSSSGSNRSSSTRSSGTSVRSSGSSRSSSSSGTRSGSSGGTRSSSSSSGKSRRR